MHSCSKWIISKPRNAILPHFGVFFVLGRIVCHRASFRPGDKEMIVNGLEEEITHAVKPERCIFATNRFFRGSEMQFCHISRYSSFSRTLVRVDLPGQEIRREVPSVSGVYTHSKADCKLRPAYFMCARRRTFLKGERPEPAR